MLLRVNKSDKAAGEKVRFAVKNLTAVDSDNKKILNNISFEIHENEVVGVAGVEGNGQTELMLALSGLMEVREGRVEMEGENICGLWPDELRRKGIGFIPEDSRDFVWMRRYPIILSPAIMNYLHIAIKEL